MTTKRCAVTIVATMTGEIEDNRGTLRVVWCGSEVTHAVSLDDPDKTAAVTMSAIEQAVAESIGDLSDALDHELIDRHSRMVAD